MLKFDVAFSLIVISMVHNSESTFSLQDKQTAVETLFKVFDDFVDKNKQLESFQNCCKNPDEDKNEKTDSFKPEQVKKIETTTKPEEKPFTLEKLDTCAGYALEIYRIIIKGELSRKHTKEEHKKTLKNALDKYFETFKEANVTNSNEIPQHDHIQQLKDIVEGKNVDDGNTFTDKDQDNAAVGDDSDYEVQEV